MPQRLSDEERICPNPNCDKLVTKVEPRFIDNNPTGVMRYSRTVGKTLIARTWIHEDGTVCDERLFHIAMNKLTKPLYLRLGDSTIDPRN